MALDVFFVATLPTLAPGRAVDSSRHAGRAPGIQVVPARAASGRVLQEGGSTNMRFSAPHGLARYSNATAQCERGVQPRARPSHKISASPALAAMRLLGAGPSGLYHGRPPSSSSVCRGLQARRRHLAGRGACLRDRTPVVGCVRRGTRTTGVRLLLFAPRVRTAWFARGPAKLGW